MLVKLWQMVSHRLIVIYIQDLPAFNLLTRDKIQQFCKISEIKIYKQHDEVDLSNGAIVFRGRVEKTGLDIDELQRDYEVKIAEIKKAQENMSLTEKLANKELIKKKTLRELATSVKQIGLKFRGSPQVAKESDIMFIPPSR